MQHRSTSGSRRGYHFGKVTVLMILNVVVNNKRCTLTVQMFTIEATCVTKINHFNQCTSFYSKSTKTKFIVRLDKNAIGRSVTRHKSDNAFYVEIYSYCCARFQIP